MIPAMRALFSTRAASVLQRAGRVMIPAVLLGLLAFASGCTAVAPYERGKLAFDVINGSPLLREWVDDPAATPADLDALATPDEKAWADERRAHLIY